VCCNDRAEQFWNGKSPGIVQDSIEGGMVLENLGPEPVTVYSHSEHRRLLKERGLINVVKHTAVPGTDQSPHTTNWARGADATFLDNAKTLVSRPRQVSGKQMLEDGGFEITSRTRGKDEAWPARWESKYRGGPGKVVGGE